MLTQSLHEQRQIWDINQWHLQLCRRISTRGILVFSRIDITKGLFDWWAKTLFAFSYIRNFDVGSTMDVTRTVFTKAMFA